MRCCIYCGKELKKDEKCDCAQSRMRASVSEKANTNKTYAKNEEQTSANKVRFTKRRNTNAGKSAVSSLKKFFFQFLRDPVYTVYNPGGLGKSDTLLLALLQGIAFSLIIFFSYKGMKTNILSFLHILGLKTPPVMTNLTALLICIPVVTLINLAVHFMISGIFYIESRYIFKRHIDFQEIAVRFVISTVPLTAVAFISVIISVFSLPAVIILLTGAAAFSVMLSYEGLNSLWNFSPSKAIYIISSGYMLYLCILYNLFIRIS